MLKLDNSIIKDHEEEFIENVNKSGFIISIGCKGGGKSFLMMAYLKHALYNKTFQHIHFVCPCYSGEQNNSYDFLKNQKHVMIYKHYTEEVSKRVDKDRKKGKTLFLIDDASGEFIKNLDNNYIQLITTTRHFEGLTVWCNLHSCKKILQPIVRQNCDHIFIYKIINAGLLQDLYDEYFSMLIDSFKEFKKIFTEIMNIEKNMCIHYSIHMDGIDDLVKYWDIVVNQDYKLVPTNAPKPKPQAEKKEKSKFSNAPINIMFRKHR